MRGWETDIQLDYDPLRQDRRTVSFVDYLGDAVESRPSIHHCAAESAIPSFLNLKTPQLGHLRFSNPDLFVSGQIHEHLDEWRSIMGDSDPTGEVNGWLANGLNVHNYIKPFKGRFWGTVYDHEFPPPRVFSNSRKCLEFKDFISETILERLRNGSINCVGRVGVDAPPYIVAPLTVEPTKPRLCVNLMYLNSWISDAHFTLDTLKDVPRVVKDDAYFTVTDDKSGFDNVRVNSDSFSLLGFQWAGYYFVCKTLPFGFKLSSYVYHTLNLQPTYYIRKMFNIPIFLYIDDRLIEEVRHGDIPAGAQSAALANYMVLEVLLRLGYCLNLKKSVFTPSQTPTFLGFVISSTLRCFQLTESKCRKFAMLRDQCLDKGHASVVELQRLAGRCVSFMLAIPAAKLYTREMNRAVSEGLKTGSSAQIQGELRNEIEHWKFIDNWDGCLKWKSEKHLTLSVSSDASLFKWGGVATLPEKGEVEISDFWQDNMKRFPIMVLEAHALLNVLKSFAPSLGHGRVDANVDNTALIAAWNNEGCKSPELNVVLKEIFNFTVEHDIYLNLIYIPSAENPADGPSRSITKLDSMLSDSSWGKIQSYFGSATGHTFDLMALDSNCMTDIEGNVLPHFTPHPTPNSSGVNMFAQILDKGGNLYVFPPFSLTLPVITFLLHSLVACTVVISCDAAIPVWLPGVIRYISDAFILGTVGATGCLMFPSKSRFVPDKVGLKQNLWVIRLHPVPVSPTYGRLLFGRHPGVGTKYNLLCLGDSILRFLPGVVGFSNPMTRVIALGGATINKMCSLLEGSLKHHTPFVLFLHGGINNMSKAFLHANEFDQMTVAMTELRAVEYVLSRQDVWFIPKRVILSKILITDDMVINARSAIFNEALHAMCIRHKWLCLDNGNITRAHLRDNVHLNDAGQRVFVQNILQCLEGSL
ncbi:MAG: reverse transcriptase domain-containing protein [Sedimenticola sp.]